MFPPTNEIHSRLSWFYRKASTDGFISSDTVKKGLEQFGVFISSRQAEFLLQEMADKKGVVTESLFVNQLALYLESFVGENPRPYATQIHLDDETRKSQLSSFYAGAITDGFIDVDEVHRALGLFGVVCNRRQAKRVLVEMAGREKRITQHSFIYEILGFVDTLPLILSHLSLPSPSQTSPTLSKSLSSPSIHPVSLPFPSIDGNLSPNGLRIEEEEYLSNLYAESSKRGTLSSEDLARICSHFNCWVSSDEARNLLRKVAGRERMITQERFVSIVGKYIQNHR
ncbi:hypothetical protein BLNAU_17022 [Blattamonas nauphoetae]|uniref:Uncharacterized protein n=1 Tax=Blattamonas nauphoetae TaxID=2049346 RepID=A0ABQ9XA33_9EUKA|nr:hypothetical protein BLNAU_17022 [Blattamonas nauphoetae]